MIRLAITGIIGLLFFAGSWFWSAALLDNSKAKEQQPAESGQVSDEVSSTAEKKEKDTPMPVPFAPKEMSESVVLELVQTVKRKEKELKKREEELARREQRLRFILDDIKLEKREFEAVVHQAQSKVIESQKILQLIESKQEKIGEDLKKIESLDAPSSSETEDAAKKETAKIFESIQPEELAATLTEYANNGEIDVACDYLTYIEKGKAAKAINAIMDAKLKKQFIDALKLAYMRKQTAEAARAKK